VKRQIFMLLVGIVLGVAVTLPLIVVAGADGVAGLTGAVAGPPDGHPVQEETPEPGSTHKRMHEMMDTMHGEGFSEQMHQAVPNSEEMMEECARHMEDMPDGHMMGMMMGGGGMHGMMDLSGHER
jgi:hypothetical protein